MKSTRVGMLVTLLILLLLESRQTIDARLLENDLFFGPGNPSAFDPQLNSAVGKTSMAAIPNHGEKTGLPCDEAGVQALKDSPQNATKPTKMLTFKFKEHRKGGEEVVYNVLPKGPTTPSGPTPKGNAAINGEKLSKSSHSPGVGHMQVFNTAKLQDGSKTRILKSTPSPGGGH